MRSSGRTQTRNNPRLHPSLFSSRFYHLKALRAQLEAAARHVAQQQPRVLVDLGCGSMPYRPLFEPYTQQYIGVDLPGNPLADVHIAPDGTTPLPDQSADTVLSTQVLEHVENPRAYLAEAYRLLKPGGLLVLSTHGYWRYHPDPTDYWRWTSSGLRKITHEAGFQIIDWRGVMGLASTSLLLFQDALLRRVPRLLRPLFIVTMQGLIALFDKLQRVANDDACVYVLIASKQET